MSVKNILDSTLIELEVFRDNPVASLKATDNGVLAVLDKNEPLFYVLTPERLTQLLAEERNQTGVPPSLIPAGKFVLDTHWRPDTDFVRQAAVWGIHLNAPVTKEELAAFVAYWQAEGCAFHHVQWQQKLARSVQRSRYFDKIKSIQNINDSSAPDYHVPEGFRSE